MTDDRTEIVTADDLDLTPDDVRRIWPDAIEYVGLDGSTCWLQGDLIDRQPWARQQ
jgi:hypothetical protein